jgi:hypothetical protein
MEITDPGTISLALQVAILFLLIIGLPFVKGKDSKNNAKRHGYSTLAAVILHTVLIFAIMFPSLSSNFEAIAGFSFVGSLAVWSHVVLGTLAEVLAVGLIVSWLLKGPSKMTCYRTKAWMTPIFVIWAVSLIGGALLHIVEML